MITLYARKFEWTKAKFKEPLKKNSLTLPCVSCNKKDIVLQYNLETNEQLHSDQDDIYDWAKLIKNVTPLDKY